MKPVPAIYMVPMPIGPDSSDSLLHPAFTGCITGIQHWVAENARTFRRVVSALQLGVKIDELQIFELSRDFSMKDLESFLQKALSSGPVGVVSEAGIPGMADPGAVVAWWAHQRSIPVIPVSGPGSISLALAASGLNGQQFTFHGYAPVKEPELKPFLEQADRQVRQTGYTQIFIEAPYRSDRMLSALLKSVAAEHKLCIACHLHSPEGWVTTRRVSEWKKTPVTLGKNPCIFLIGR